MRILAFGDSITQGFHDTECGGWCNRLISEVMQREVVTGYEYNRSVVNLGISGDTSEDVLSRVRSESESRLLKYPSTDGDVLLLAIGVNDSQFEMATGENKISTVNMISNLEQIVKTTKDLFSQVVIVGIAPVWDARIQPMAWKKTHGYANKVIEKYNETLARFATDHNYHFIDMSNVYTNSNDCLPDGIHPNAEGHRLIFERVKSELEKAGVL